MTHSLVFDRDFNLYNNVEKRDSLLFFDRVVNGFSGGVELFGQYARGDKATAKREYWSNKRYSNLNLGLSIMIAPFHALGLLWDAFLFQFPRPLSPLEGERFREVLKLKIPEDLEKGPYQIVIGLWDEIKKKRIKIKDLKGKRVAKFTIGELVVE